MAWTRSSPLPSPATQRDARARTGNRRFHREGGGEKPRPPPSPPDSRAPRVGPTRNRLFRPRPPSARIAHPPSGGLAATLA
ncbi:hypothetical protein DAI22_02g193100 [Oryza sativa Japonica Group]|nr:hypothetical protein DAI22_02g193100 [Oryza sativa Japonica Group]